MQLITKLSLIALLLRTVCFAQVNNSVPEKSNTPASERKTNKKPNFTYQDVFRLKRASVVQISPDGKWVVYVRSFGNLMTDKKKKTIWLINVETGVSKQFYAHEAGDPAWSQDSRKIAFTTNDEKGNTQLFVKDITSLKTTQITNVRSAPQNPVWSPDGQSIAFTMFKPEKRPTIGHEILKPTGADWVEAPRIYEGPHILSDGSGFLNPGHTHIFITTLKDTVTKQITTGAYNDQSGLEWTKDSHYLIFSSKRGPDAYFELWGTSTLFKVNVSNNEIQEQKMAGYATSALVSPDGKKVLFIGTEDLISNYGKYHYYIMNLDGSDKMEILPSFDFELTDLHWAPDSHSLFISYGEKGITKLANTTFGGKLKVLASDLGDDSFSFSISKNGMIACSKDSAGRPGEVTVIDKFSSKRLTTLNDSLLNGINLATYKALHVKSSFDQHPVGSWLLLPPNYDSLKHYPMILKIHGGPHGYDGPTWISDNQLYAAAGYVVLTVNYRASTSYGYDFARPSYENYQKNAFADLMSAVDGAIAAGIANPDRLFVMGGSAGGQLTAWIVGNTTRFKAAIAIKPITNLLSEGLTSDQYLGDANLFNAKSLWDDAMEYWKYSPLSLVGNIQTPTLLIVGEEDKRTPPSESLQFYHALQLRKIPTAFVLVPGASHEGLNSKPSQLVSNVSICLGWFGRYGGIE